MDVVAKLQRCKAPLILQHLADEIYRFELASKSRLRGRKRN